MRDNVSTIQTRHFTRRVKTISIYTLLSRSLFDTIIGVQYVIIKLSWLQNSWAHTTTVWFITFLLNIWSKKEKKRTLLYII